MRYWGLLAAKLAMVVALTAVFWNGLDALFPAREGAIFTYRARIGYDLRWAILLGTTLLAGAGLLHLAILDQRYRCRTCLRRLRMPVDRGSWSHMLRFGQPRTEYICRFGHGTLRVPQVHLTGIEQISWRENADIWTELEELDRETAAR